MGGEKELERARKGISIGEGGIRLHVGLLGSTVTALGSSVCSWP